MKTKPVRTLAEFRERIASITGLGPVIKHVPANLVRRPTDRGYNPPKREQQHRRK